MYAEFIAMIRTQGMERKMSTCPKRKKNGFDAAVGSAMASNPPRVILAKSTPDATGKDLTADDSVTIHRARRQAGVRPSDDDPTGQPGGVGFVLDSVVTAMTPGVTVWILTQRTVASVIVSVGTLLAGLKPASAIMRAIRRRRRD